MSDYRAKINADGMLEIDIGAVLRCEDGDPLFDRLAEHAAFSDAVIRRVIDHVLTGASEGCWYYAPSTLERIRKDLLPSLPKAVAELVAGLTNERDRALAMRDRWRNACWDIARYWESMDWNRKNKIEDVSYQVDHTMTKSEALAMVQRLIDEDEGKSHE